MFVIFDLDGTLALNRHRQHYVEGPKHLRDWPAFFAECDRDSPYWQVIEILKALKAAGHRIEIWSRRSAKVLFETRQWLAPQGLETIPLRYRGVGDNTPDAILKKAWLDLCSPKPDFVFDDRASVVAMWRAEGIACAQVAEGNF